MYWVSLVVPDWPSCLSASKRGMTTVSSWMMMLAVMYGMIPSANTDSWSSAPPLKRLTSRYSPAWSTLGQVDACWTDV